MSRFDYATAARNSINGDFSPLVAFLAHLDLLRLNRNVRRRIVFDDFRVAEAINEVFRAKVVRVNEPAPKADNAD